MPFSAGFTEAIRDYSYFLERDYPQKSLLKMIGDRYRLDAVQRTVLFRGVVKTDIAESRKAKLAEIDELENSAVNIDGYNVLISVASYLNGTLIFISNDGLLRDASESHGKLRKSEHFFRAAELTLDFLKTLGISEANFYFDRPVSNSAELSAEIKNMMGGRNLNGTSEIAASPDHVLKCVTAGFCSSSDSSVIDNAKTKIFDLARNVITGNFKPEIIQLKAYMKKADR